MVELSYIFVNLIFENSSLVTPNVFSVNFVI